MNRKMVQKKIFFESGLYILLIIFCLIVGLTVKYYVLDQLDIDDGKPVFNFLSALLSAVGGLISLKRMQLWGGYKSQVGKILLFFSLALFAWSVGTIVWLCYGLFLNLAVPYPSWADLGYIFINPFMLLAVGSLGYLTALKSTQEHARTKIYFFFIPVCMALLTYFTIFIVGHQGDIQVDSVLKLLLDFYYTGGDVAQVVILMLVSGTAFNYLGERLRLPFTLIISSVFISYIADSLYTYSTSVEVYRNGDFIDLLYALYILLVSLGLYTLHPRLLEDK